MDEMKIIKSSNSKSSPCHPQTATYNQTLSGPTRATPKFIYTPNSNMSPMASFLREFYKYTSTSNGSKELAIAISC
jgi:hypothetical protein